MSMKNPLTPAGIKPATFRFVTQHLNHCATAVPLCHGYWSLLFVSSLSYKKSRTRESEVEACRLIRASPLDDVASENVCSHWEKYS